MAKSRWTSLWNEIRIAFRVGDSVTIKLGVLAGRTGLVEVIDGNSLIVRELNTLREVRRNKTN